MYMLNVMAFCWNKMIKGTKTLRYCNSISWRRAFFIYMHCFCASVRKRSLFMLDLRSVFRGKRLRYVTWPDLMNAGDLRWRPCWKITKNKKAVWLCVCCDHSVYSLVYLFLIQHPVLCVWGCMRRSVLFFFLSAHSTRVNTAGISTNGIYFQICNICFPFVTTCKKTSLINNMTVFCCFCWL